MKVIGVGNNSVTLELDPGDLFLLAEACRETVSNDAGTDQDRTDLMGEALTLAAMAAATWEATTGSQNRTIAEVRTSWLPGDDDTAR